MKNLTKILFLIPLLSTTSHLNAAGSATGSLLVTATILSNCQVATSSGSNTMPFGNYTNTALNMNGSLSVTCTSGTAYRVALGTGANGASTSARQMLSGTTLLPYSLYSDSARTKNWGMVANTDDVGGTGTGSAQTLTIYGTIPANGGTMPGAYSDQVTITVNYT